MTWLIALCSEDCCGVHLIIKSTTTTAADCQQCYQYDKIDSSGQWALDSSDDSEHKFS